MDEISKGIGDPYSDDSRGPPGVIRDGLSPEGQVYVTSALLHGILNVAISSQSQNCCSLLTRS